jgi:hypothetical protein
MTSDIVALVRHVVARGNGFAYCYRGMYVWFPRHLCSPS